jgi:hypothetical protein
MATNYEPAVLGLRELVHAYAEHRFWGESDGEHARYAALRFRLLSDALGIPEDWAWAGQTSDGPKGPIPFMMDELVDKARPDFFMSGVMEYPAQPGELEVVQALLPGIREAQAALAERFMELAVALLINMRPTLKGKAVSEEALRRLGLPPAPVRTYDEDDY